MIVNKVPFLHSGLWGSGALEGVGSSYSGLNYYTVSFYTCFDFYFSG